MSDKSRKTILTIILIGFLFVLAWLAERCLDEYVMRVVRTGLIYVIAAVGYNLINGIAGQFSLGPNGFMALGGYMVALLMLPLDQKKFVWFLQPLIWPFNAFSFSKPFFPLAVALGGVAGALGALIVGIPSLRLRGDYLAIATFGFSQIIIVLANNLIPITNGALGIKGIPEYADIYRCLGWAIVAVLIISNLANSSYGRAMKSVRDDEVAAEAMGIPVFRIKLLAFVVSGFFAGVAGGLMASLITTVSPNLFSFSMTFNLLIIIVLGGLGSITGSAVTAFAFALISEVLRFVESPMTIGPIHIPGIAGMRMLVFSLLLVLLMIFYRRGLFGKREISWDWVFARFGKITGKGAEAWSHKTERS
ncbi:MAG: branched-chain amino acid ABC transporter permease [Bacillota bacterium]|jgi:branched-chain amino acid transport system permease protein|nr:branched-chain amino acid ABC transporter permease [Bacillota bacterium]MDI9414446.1 branched-chain amino acid ABC transporter permease [Bacillota bacterium]NLD12387.1 branched-chain amino acid ABC transporter permease [Bacillota bacterium]HAV20931.1 branched-chain amino acid ABC transporter permease [Bacillota bacterium]HOB89312.1 branched-chain amino acid ABC transporter permease [Bacillota bacterium]